MSILVGIYYTIFIWVAAGIAAMLVDYLLGWPSLRKDTDIFQRHMEEVRRLDPEADPRFDICWMVLLFHVALGPLAFLQ